MTLTDHRSATFSLSALAAAVAAFVAGLPATPGDERVAAVPDERTLRYYQSLGLLDRPLRYDGRAAIYGYRHLLQALAVRVLQVRGFSLAQAQGALAGATDASLEAAVQEALGAAVPSAQPSRQAPAPPAAEWRTVEVAPGVLLTVDLRRHPDPSALLAAAVAALAPAPPSPRGNRP